MGYTSYKTKTNKTQTQHRKQRVNLVLTIQKKTGYMGYTSYKTKTNKTKTQHRKQRVIQELTVQRNWIHEIHKLQDEDKQNKNTTQKTESQSIIDCTEKLDT